MIANWVFEENVVPLMQVLSSLAGYEWDQWDRDAVVVGLADSDGESDRWFHYPRGDPPTVDIRLARDPGTRVVQIRINASHDLHDRIDLALTMAQEFELKAWE